MVPLHLRPSAGDAVQASSPPGTGFGAVRPPPGGPGNGAVKTRTVRPRHMRVPQHLRPSGRNAVHDSPPVGTGHRALPALVGSENGPVKTGAGPRHTLAGAPRAVQPRERGLRDERLLLLGCAALAAFALLYNVFTSPDTFADEIGYTQAAQNVAVSGHLTWTNVPVFVHPPLFFLLQAGWLMLTGYAHGSQIWGAIQVARLLSAVAGAASVLLVAGLAYRLVPYARLRRRQWLTVLVAVMAALDPVLVRYSRQVAIEPFALAASLLVLHAAWSLRHRGFAYVWVTGLLTGLALLTNEITVFIVATPVIFACLQRDRALLRRSVAAFAIGAGFMTLWLLWSIELGLGSTFIADQTFTFERLVGLIQDTGYHAPGTSLVGSLVRYAGQYLSSYIVLALGAAALCWLWLRRGSAESRFLTAWLTLSYALGCYIAAVGTFNEEFLVYVIPAAIVAVVLVGEAAVTEYTRTRGRRVPRARARRVVGRSTATIVVAGLLSASGVAWAVDYSTRQDGVARMDQFLARRLPACSVVNASGDVKYGSLLPGWQFSLFSVGPAALADGVHDFLLAPNDAVAMYGNMSPALASWIRSNGREVVSFPSKVYSSVELWQVGPRPYDALADTVDTTNGVFINTTGSRCGGFSVTNSARSGLYTTFAAIGGKAVLGPPRSAAFRTRSGTTEQLFDGGVLVAPPTGLTIPQPAMLAVVADLAARAPGLYLAANLPPVVVARSSAVRTAWLTDPGIRRSYLGSSPLSAASISRGRREFGVPLGPPQRVSDGMVAQPFAGAVLEHAAGSDDVHAADIATLLQDAGVIVVPHAAQELGLPPALPAVAPLGTAQPSTVVPFVWTLAGALAGYAAIVFVLSRRRHRRGSLVRRKTAQ